MDQLGLSQSADEFAVATVELVVQQFDAGAVAAEQLDHGAFVIFEDEDIAFDDVVEAVVLGEESVEAVTPFDILGNQDGVF